MALEKRKRTLLVEYQANKKVNTFKDRRFGEGDPSVSLEERMLMRFQKERQRRARRSSSGMYNLDQTGFEDDDEDGGLRLTHKGRAIGDQDFVGAGDGFGSSDEEDERGQLGRDIVKVS
jgi:nucleolar protein 14